MYNVEKMKINKKRPVGPFFKKDTIFKKINQMYLDVGITPE